MPKEKKNIKVRDLKPRKDAKGGRQLVSRQQASSHEASGQNPQRHFVSHR
jgi:hypothetical protein